MTAIKRKSGGTYQTVGGNAASATHTHTESEITDLVHPASSTTPADIRRIASTHTEWGNRSMFDKEFELAAAGTSRLIRDSSAVSKGWDTGSLSWPCVLYVDDILDSPIDKYYLWCSTDHATQTGGDPFFQVGGIFLFTAPAPLGPWTLHDPSGDGSDIRVYVDTVVGEETETPTVVWNPTTSLFHMYYHQQDVGHLQTTCLATSPDGVSWTRVGPVIDWAGTTDLMGDGHTGYAAVNLIGSRWYARSQSGGSTGAVHQVMWTSEDGINWIFDPVQIRVRDHAVMHNGRWYFFTEYNGTITLHELSQDMRHVVNSKDILTYTYGTPWADKMLQHYPFVDVDGRVYVYFSERPSAGSRGDSRAIGVLTEVGVV